MSKYIDAERLNMEWQTLKPFGVTDTMIENLKWIVDRQPTIEVGEKVEDERCKGCKHYKLACDLFSEICKYEPITQTETQNSNLTFEIADTPKAKVSEDCISREHLLSKVYDMDNDNLVVDLKDIEDAPSIDIVRCKDCKFADSYKTLSGEWRYYCRESGVGGREKDDYCSYGERSEE